jgi:phosphoglycerate-specific signal transduction histidine kinase
VALDLVDNRRGRVREELHAALRVEAIHSLHQADGGDLGQVVQRLAWVAETTGQLLGERQVHTDQLIAQFRVLA